MALVKEWLRKPRRTDPVIVETPETRTGVFIGLTSADIQSRIVGQSINVYQNAVLIATVMLDDITGIDINNNYLIIYSDDRAPLTLGFVSALEAGLGFDKLEAAGNGEAV